MTKIRDRIASRRLMDLAKQAKPRILRKKDKQAATPTVDVADTDARSPTRSAMNQHRRKIPLEKVEAKYHLTPEAAAKIDPDVHKLAGKGTKFLRERYDGRPGSIKFINIFGQGADGHAVEKFREAFINDPTEALDILCRNVLRYTPPQDIKDNVLRPLGLLLTLDGPAEQEQGIKRDFLKALLNDKLTRNFLNAATRPEIVRAHLKYKRAYYKRLATKAANGRAEYPEAIAAKAAQEAADRGESIKPAAGLQKLKTKAATVWDKAMARTTNFHHSDLTNAQLLTDIVLLRRSAKSRSLYLNMAGDLFNKDKRETQLALENASLEVNAKVVKWVKKHFKRDLPNSPVNSAEEPYPRQPAAGATKSPTRVARDKNRESIQAFMAAAWVSGTAATILERVVFADKNLPGSANNSPTTTATSKSTGTSSSANWFVTPTGNPELLRSRSHAALATLKQEVERLNVLNAQVARRSIKGHSKS